ncbi:MAG: hypothetical protein ACXVEE_14775 [Polyangiales bacterium]
MRLITVLLATLMLGCPGTREGSGGGSEAGSASSLPPAFPAVAPSSLPGATAASADEAKSVALRAGEPIAADMAPTEGEVFGLEVLFEVRLKGLAPPPTPLGAVPTAIATAQTATVGTLRASIGAGRFRARAGRRAFALADGWELRADRRHGGMLVVLGGEPISYRVVQAGATRALFSERRLDVSPLGPARIAEEAPGSHLARSTTRTSITTTYGTLLLDQIAAPTAPLRPVVSTKDAKAETGELSEAGFDGAGVPLCRLLLELVAADRALGGVPCADGLVPVRAEIAWSAGGGVVIEATSLREGTLSRAELAFPPSGARLSTAALGEVQDDPFGGDALLAIRSKGEAGALELSNKSPQPRIATIDGIPVVTIPPGGDRKITLRTGKYVLEWRSPLGERAERTVEIDVPGKSSSIQWVPAPPSSASPIASVRNGP